MFTAKSTPLLLLFVVACGGPAEPVQDEFPSALNARQSALLAQHQNANAHQWWNLPAKAWNIDQIVVPKIVSGSSYFAHVFFFERNPNGNDGAYMGLQEGTTPFWSRQARFSIWNATAATGSECRDFGGEGIGKTCTIAFPYIVDRVYTLRIWRLSVEESGTWWGAWVIDSVTGTETHIGSIRAPRGTGDIASTDSFDEYFGDARPCNAVPRSMVMFGAPAINGNTAHASYGSTSVGRCSGGLVTPTIYGVSVLELGR